MKKNRKAFTLIELLVVILILAILAAMIVPRVLGRAGDAKRAKAASDLKVLSDTLQHYHMDNDVYPTTEEGLAALREAPASAKNWRGPYTQTEITKDPWGNDYIYTSPGPKSDDSFEIVCYGKDGAEGGTDESADIVVDSE